MVRMVISHEMGGQKAVKVMGILMVLSWAQTTMAAIDCSTVTALVSA